MTVSSQYSFVSSSLIASAEVNDNFNRIYLDTPGNLGLKNYDAQHNSDGTHQTVTVDTLAAANGIVVTAGGIIISAGGLVVTAGGIIITAGGLTVSAGDVTLDSGSNIIVTSGNATINGDVTFSGSLSPLSVTGSSVLVTASVGIDKLASMGVGVVTGSAGDFCVGVTSIYNYITADQIFRQVTSSVTITTTGRPIFIGLFPDAASSAIAAFIGGGGVTAGSSLHLNIIFARDGTYISNTYININSGASESLGVPPASFSTIDIVGAGTYTYTVLLRETTGLSRAVDIYYCKLVAFEL